LSLKITSVRFSIDQTEMLLRFTFLQYSERNSVPMRSSPINHTHRNGMPASISRERIMATHFIPCLASTSLAGCHLSPSGQELAGWSISFLCLTCLALWGHQHASPHLKQPLPFGLLNPDFYEYCSVPIKSVHCTITADFFFEPVPY